MASEACLSLLRVHHHGDVTYFRMTRTLLGRPRYWTGCYLLDGLLIDCGPPALARELASALEGHALEQLALTHHHEDHMGGAALLGERRGLVPRIHERGVAALANGFPVELYRRYAWGRPGRVHAEPLGDRIQTRGFTLQVVHTPGHSPDHVCLFEPERGLLFSGDLFLAERLRYLREDEDLLELIASLRAVARLGARELFCAHRGLVPDGPGALRRKAEHLEGVRDSVRELLARGVSPAEAARRAVGREGLLTLFSLGRFSARNFVRAVARGLPGG